jgi:hypothetical protein
MYSSSFIASEILDFSTCFRTRL